MFLCMTGAGPIAAFLRPVPPVQPEAEAKSQASLLAAAAAAAAVQQATSLQATVQIWLTPAAGDGSEGALAALAKPWLSCPADMKVEQLSQASVFGLEWPHTCCLKVVHVCRAYPSPSCCATLVIPRRCILCSVVTHCTSACTTLQKINHLVAAPVRPFSHAPC